MKKLLITVLFIFLSTAVNSAFAAPKEIIIIRHGDKLVQSEPGPVLSPQGMVRSIAFASYFLNKFGAPDFIIATGPTNAEGKDSSLRELQTVAPLANMLAARHAQTGFPILHPYQSSDYAKLAADLLTNKQFDGKQILVCWNHTKIPQLAELLGVTQSLKKWPADDFDSVYVLQYNANGRLKKFTVLNRQYEVVFNGSWQALYDKLKN